MNRLTTAAAFATVALGVMSLLPSTVSAKETRFTDKAGRFGLGYDTSLGNVGGLSTRFQVAKNFGIQAIAGFDRISFETLDQNQNGVSDNSLNDIRVAVRGDVAVAFTRQAALGIIFGVNIYSSTLSTAAVNDSGAAEQDVSETQFSFEVGLKSEYHFTDWFSVHGEVGVLFALVGRDDEVTSLFGSPGADPSRVLTPPTEDAANTGSIDGSVVRFGRGEPVGNFGFTFWFN